jgi:hypothetical protein
MSKDQAGHFIHKCQELRDQVQQMDYSRFPVPSAQGDQSGAVAMSTFSHSQ